jgi:hypothetical protein
MYPKLIEESGQKQITAVDQAIQVANLKNGSKSAANHKVSKTGNLITTTPNGQKRKASGEPHKQRELEKRNFMPPFA